MQVGWFVFTPLVVKVILIGISGVITLLGYPRDEYSLIFDDEYVSMNTNEIYHNIRSIKMFGWERMYLDPKLDVYARSDDRKEDNSRYAQLARAIWFIYKLIEGVFSELSTGISIYLYCKYGEGAFIFSNGDIYNIFNILSSLNNQLTNIKHYFDNAQESIEYVNKMEKLLISKPINTLPNSVDKDVDPIITIDNGEFKWDSKTLAAKNVSFTAKPGDLVAVVGKTASGKSSLLYSLCSEVEMSNGTGLANGSVAYVEQSPWIMSGTLRDNILFGRGFDEKHYNDVIYACALDTDIKGWKDRDLTMLGERGINISGGQKTRLALARALYSRADIYILDDPLSAIDAHVKRHILDHVIMSTGMLKNKIRIVSSNDNKIIPYFNTVLTVDDGYVTTSSQLAKKYQLSSPSPMHKVYIHNTDNINADTLNQQLKKETSTATTTSKTSSNIMYIFKLCGVPIIASFVLLILLDLIGKHIMDNLRLNTLNANTDSTNMESNGFALKLIYIEMAKQFASSVSNAISNKLDHSVTSKIKHRIKDIFERSLVYAPLSFYDRKLRQQITADKYQARNLASEIIEFISRVTSSYISSAFALYSICINRPQLLIVIPFVVTIEITKNVILRPLKTFLDKFKSDAHVEGDKISDVIADGEHLIRIYGVGKHFTEKYIANIDEKLSVKLPTSNIHDFQRFIYNILHDTVSTMCNLCVVLMSSCYGKRLTSGDYISYRYLVDNFSYYLSDLTDIPRYLEKITKGVSLLREYTDAEQETLFDDSALNPEGVWPTKGKVEFKDFSMKYREDLEYSLKNINLTINSGEKVGIVGRTGVGKSSITRVLFRLVNNNLCNGSITIDGYDINKMDLGYLRPRLGIIPQDPTLFDSSFKKNFDPLEEYSIEDIWAGVVKCDLAELVQPKRDPEDSSDDETWKDYQNRNIQKNIDKWNKEYKDGTWPYKMFMLLFLTKPKLIQHDDSYTWKVKHGLDTFAFMNSDYSNGQKQIISLCRLVIRQHKLIVLDEATSSVDLDTDQEMHNLIRSEFKDSTVLTIAHRLETIMKSDRIIVMDKGQIAEVGTPAELLQANGLFSELVKANDFGE